MASLAAFVGSSKSARAPRRAAATESLRHITASVPGLEGDPLPVSYTHLRAHETSLHLVCRLLLEKK